MEFNVVANIKVYIDDPASMDEVKKSIEGIENIKVQKFWEEDVGFGIKALKVSMLLPDTEGGGMDSVEAKISSMDHVSQMEVESLGRV